MNNKKRYLIKFFYGTDERDSRVVYSYNEVHALGEALNSIGNNGSWIDKNDPNFRIEIRLDR